MRIERVVWLLAVSVFATGLYGQNQGQIAPPQVRTGPQQVETQNQPENQQKGKVNAKGPVPMTEKEVMKELKNSPPETLIKDVNDRGVSFDMTPSIEKKLRKENASDQVVAAVRDAGPTVRANTAKMMIGPGPGGVQMIPKEQAQAFDVIRGEADPDKSLALVDDFAKKYPDSHLLPYAYLFAASDYDKKNDAEEVVDYAGKGLKLDPDNVACLILRVDMMPTPQYLKNHGAERDQILQETEKEANRALELIPKVPKRPGESDADYQKLIQDNTSQVHASLGLTHLELAAESLVGPDKNELAKSEQEFKIAVSTAPSPQAQDYFRLGEAYSMDGKLDDAIQAFTKAGQLDQGTVVKTYADQRIAELKNRKAHAPNP